MKSVVRVVLLALVLGFTAARAEPLPPGLTETEWLHSEDLAKRKVADIFAEFGRQSGYREGQELGATDAKCMFAVAAEAVVRAARTRATTAAVKERFTRAIQWLEEEVAKWCSRNGPPPGNRAIQMLKLAGQKAHNSTLNRDAGGLLPSGWKKQLDALLKKDEWTPGEVALVGTVVFVLLAREAVPIP
ncbi:hypothetical protein FJV41_19820 [Myxococcus llanfairpwllgwyngyllgogerychwyrndrobwllllantysiliogogogochensis]|uniref:Lipoprotein n=1 Tax=Myxococcus llanfairpwllgwyngyllgogerychwyrndrobwllllantysiliogogogochensis TaxID=2590453 RepID=A0A540WZ03_9BACT|nr:hypothetical protein [Myxococcus llanfairpwllgwyngyllgogerychwyrndrobwllllantysiliogogogochensis]TQF14219.1 hypothetical protein FJV41_19820 [Myxococcus llanfairpwllgwyngyllgogerychwyrndrobwllllantysiliogogogochensis]